MHRIAALLYVAAAGMLAEAGFLFVRAAFPEEPPETRIRLAADAARQGLRRGHAAVRPGRGYDYLRRDWWARFETFRCTGADAVQKEPRRPQDPTPRPEPPPLYEQVELLSVLFDRDPEGQSHVLLRYRADEGVEDTAHELRIGDRLREPLHVWTLTRIAEDAESVVFANGDNGEQVELFKAWLQLRPEVLDKIHRLRNLLGEREPVRPAPGGATVWRDLPETRIVDGEVHVSRTDVQSLKEDETLLRTVHLEAYRERTGKVRGVRLRAVDALTAGRYGLRIGDVLLSLNGVEITTPASVYAEGKRQYERGVRTFRLEMLRDGLLMERVLRLPPD